MIYTVTLNPSIDYVVETDKLKIGEVNRSNKEELYPGGKGINVSLMLRWIYRRIYRKCFSF